MVRSQRNIPAVITLFFVAPLVAEFLLGNLSLKLLPALIVLAPFYGGGAILIRETVRGAGRGWPSILVLGAAYTLVEEAFSTQSLFNPDYLHLHMHLLDHAWIPALGIGAWWTLFMLNLHTFWSISVSIALVEGVFPAPSSVQAPWLGKVGDSVIGVVFLAGLLASCAITIKQDHFIASHAQFGVAAALIVVLIVAAFLIPQKSLNGTQGVVPSAWITGAVALVLGFGVLVIPPGWNWGAFAAMLGIDVIFLVLLAVFSKRIGWTALHTFSLGAGGALAYGLHAFIETPVGGGTGMIARVGNGIFLALAVGLIALGARRIVVSRQRTENG